MTGTEEVRDDNNSWLWMKKGYLKIETRADSDCTGCRRNTHRWNN